MSELQMDNCTRVVWTSAQHDGDKHTPLWQLAVEYEMARGNFTEREVVDRVEHRLRRKCTPLVAAHTVSQHREAHAIVGQWRCSRGCVRVGEG